MRTFEAMLTEYKSKPNESLKDELVNRLLQVADPSKLDELDIVKREDWVQYGDNLSVKWLYGSIYIVAEVYSYGDDKRMCFAYRVDLEDYSPAQHTAYCENCKEYRKVSADENYLAAVSVAAALDEDKAVERYVASSIDLYEAWLERIEKEIC